MGEKKLDRVELRLTSAEKAALQSLADAAGCSVGELVRRRTIAAANAAPSAQGHMTLPAASTHTTHPPVDPHAAPITRRAVIQSYKLDMLGPDPLRGGMRSARR